MSATSSSLAKKEAYIFTRFPRWWISQPIFVKNSSPFQVALNILIRIFATPFVLVSLALVPFETFFRFIAKKFTHQKQNVKSPKQESTNPVKLNNSSNSNNFPRALRPLTFTRPQPLLSFSETIEEEKEKKEEEEIKINSEAMPDTNTAVINCSYRNVDPDNHFADYLAKNLMDSLNPTKPLEVIFIRSHGIRVDWKEVAPDLTRWLRGKVGNNNLNIAIIVCNRTDSPNAQVARNQFKCTEHFNRSEIGDLRSIINDNHICLTFNDSDIHNNSFNTAQIAKLKTIILRQGNQQAPSETPTIPPRLNLRR